MTHMARSTWSNWLAVAFVFVSCLTGCSLWPFAEKDRTPYVTPASRVTAIQQLGAQADGADVAAQQELATQLAGQIQTERDPLVREAIIRAAAQMHAPMADRILLAALNDSDSFVRQTACKLVGRRGDVSAVAALGNVAQDDVDIDVRLAATRALGELRHASAVPYLSTGLHESDPAIQLAAVHSLKLASGEDLGNDVGAWREWVASRERNHAGNPSLAGRQNAATVSP
jgi:HEAT repeat protein